MYFRRHKKLMKGKQTFWNFKEIVELEQRYNFKSTFNFSAKKGFAYTYYITNPELFYDITKQKYKILFEYLKNKGWEIGLHTSYLAYLSKDTIENERKKLMKYSQTEVLGNRHHYGHIPSTKFNRTLKLHQKAGFLYDSTLLFDRCSGFRRRICTPFRFFDEDTQQDIQTIELPTGLVDSQLFYTLKCNYYKNRERIMDELINVVREYNGVLVVDYHVRGFNSVFFPEWKQSYIELLDKITKHNDFYCDTAINLIRYWIERDKKLEALSR